MSTIQSEAAALEVALTGTSEVQLDAAAVELLVTGTDSVHANAAALELAVTGTDTLHAGAVVIDMLIIELVLDTPLPPLQGQAVARATHLQGRIPGLRRGPGPLI